MVAVVFFLLPRLLPFVAFLQRCFFDVFKDLVVGRARWVSSFALAPT